MQPLLLWKLIIITYSECLSVALDIQHEKRMRRIAISALPRSTIFFSLSHKRNDFWKNVIEHKMCFDFFFKFCLQLSSFQ